MKKSRNGEKRVLDTPRPKKRMLGACILFMTVVLALATAVMATGGKWDSSGSYSLVIEKKFDPTMDEDVLAAAKQQTYSFRVKGYREDGDRNKIEIDEIVEIGPDSTGWQSATLKSEGPIYVSVTEITNDVTLNVNGKDYNMGDSRSEVTTLFTESPQVRELNNNGRIVLSRPATKLIPTDGEPIEAPVTTTSSFRITSKWTAAESAKPADWQEFNRTVTLGPGSTYTFDQLSAGEYTIEDLSVSGYNIQLGERTQEVGPEGTGTFYINSKPGKLVITAGGTVGDGGRHYYEIKRVSAPSDAQPFVDRVTEAVASGETYTLDNLPRGKYEVTEYSFADAPTEFKVKAATEESVTTKTLKSEFGTTSARWIRFPMQKLDCEYITDLKFGPLRNAKDNFIAERFTYNFGIRYRETADQVGYTTSTWSTNPRKANTIYSFTSPIYSRTDNSLAFAVWNVTATTGDHVDLSWTEHYTEELTCHNAGQDYTIKGVDERGWIEITAPAADSSTPGVEGVTYTYTLRKTADGPVVQTLTLNPGETKKIEGLEAGSYLVMETVNTAEKAGFKMAISGDPFGSNEAGKDFDLTVMGDRVLTISKPNLKEGQSDGGRTYTFNVVSKNTTNFGEVVGTVTIRSGESNSSITLPAGDYTVTPLDDRTEVFELTSSDTSQVHAQVPSKNPGTVTFTNVFTPGELGYRYVHEYYIKDANGNFRYEGCSPVTTVGGRTDPDEFYNSVDITKEPGFTINGETYTYDYMPENNGYGVVDTDTGGDTTAGNGLRLRSHAIDKFSGSEISYQVDNDMTAAKKIGVDADKSQIIILRYFRVLPEDQRGHYKYIHVYYLRDKDGDHWEGSSAIGERVGQLNLPYRAGEHEAVQPVTRFQPTENNSENQTYDYVYNQRPSYGTLSDDHSDPLVELYRQVDSSETTHRHYRPNSDADHIVATADGDNIIILRYYREVSPTVTEGTYNVVHEYYFREELEDQDPGDVSEDPEDSEGVGADGQSEDGIAPQSNDEEETEGGSSFSGTLSSDDRYSYTFEGALTVENISAPLGSTHQGENVDKKEDWRPAGSETSHRYTYYDAVYGNTGADSSYSCVSNMEWASSTEEGDEIIILRYYRGDDSPTPPDKPNPPGGGDNPDPTDPENPPTDPENPSTDPENPPEYPTELPDPNDPDSPDEITIWEDGVPKTYIKVWDPESETWIYIPEEDVPLWTMVPQTGDRDSTEFWTALAAVSLCGLAVLTVPAKKRKNR